MVKDQPFPFSYFAAKVFSRRELGFSVMRNENFVKEGLVHCSDGSNSNSTNGIEGGILHTFVI